MVKTADRRRDTLRQATEPVVADFMTTDLVTVTLEMPLIDVVDLMLNKGVSNVPVVKPTRGGNKLVGLVTERDCLNCLTDAIFYDDPSITVESIMKHIPVCVTPEIDVFTVSSIFTQQGYRHLPVVKKTMLLGIVSRRDVLRGLKDYRLKLHEMKESERKLPDLREILMNRRLIIK